MSLFLKLSLTITPPSPSSCIKKPKDQRRPLPSILSLNSSMVLSQLLYLRNFGRKMGNTVTPIIHACGSASSHGYLLVTICSNQGTSFLHVSCLRSTYAHTNYALGQLHYVLTVFLKYKSVFYIAYLFLVYPLLNLF